jgi:hypothetical protein
MRITLVSAAAAAFAVTGAGCSSRSDDSVYCVDRNHRVVDDRYCDDTYPGGGSRFGYLLWHRPGRYYYSPGMVVYGGDLIRTDDAAARSRLGLSRSGHVTSGVVTRGGFGGGSHSGGS